MAGKTYIAIDLKSFYASVECHERGLDPLTTNLVVADPSRTEKTICLAVSPSLKAYGIPGRARLFEVIQKVKEVNRGRKCHAPGHEFAGTSWKADELKRHPELELDFITAPPRMALYLDYSTRIYHIYLKYFAPEDIHVYSIDEVFVDASSYLNTYQMTAKELMETVILDILKELNITATGGIGTNLYLCKIAMDIMAKHVEPNEHGVRIGELDEISYREKLWAHKPITDFWRVGRGYAKKLEEHGMYTMGDIARCSLGKENAYHNMELLYKLFGVNAELLIDHAWGVEPCTMAEVKAYKPEYNSIGSGQVLHCPYMADKARLVAWEMADALALQLVEKRLVTDQIVLTVGYDINNLTGTSGRKYSGEVKVDWYGRKIPKHAHGTVNLGKESSSAKLILSKTMELYDRIVEPQLMIRRINLVANHVMDEREVQESEKFEQMDLFSYYEKSSEEKEREQDALKKERDLQEAMLEIKKRYGKNAMLKGTNFLDGATARERNNQIGGHKA